MLNAAVVEPQAFVFPQSVDFPVEAGHVAPVRVALLARLEARAGSPLTQRLQLVHVANSRKVFHPSPNGDPQGSAKLRELGVMGIRVTDFGCPSPDPAGHPLPKGEGITRVTAALGIHHTRILIDATASDQVADHHAQWLAQGIHVVTACKLGQGTSLARWRSIRVASRIGGARYGDSATVGAGLPVLRTLRELQAGGDRIHAIAGVLSGSLAWLCNHYDGMRPFSALVRQARNAGYTEPDPREDLSGEDVCRKLLILARASGCELEADAIEVASLVRPELAALAKQDVDAALPELDAPMRERYAQAYRNGEKLRFIARLERSDDGRVRARVGLESLAPDHPLAGGAGTDNRVAIWSDRYRNQPLVIQGPGAGAEVTAAALLDDVLGIANL